MPQKRKTWTKARSEYAILVKDLGRDDPATVAALQEFKALKLEDYIRKVLQQKPPLTAEQRERIASVLD